MNTTRTSILLLAVAVGICRAEDASKKEEQIRTDGFTGLGCKMKADRSRIEVGETVRLRVAVKSDRIEHLYLYFTPPDAPDQISRSGPLPDWRRIQVTTGKLQMCTVDLTPKESGTYTFCAQVSNASPTAAFIPFRAFSKPLTIVAKRKPQQEDGEGR
ncbi:MAG: hypothetical protein HON70_21630 [Lentisphaerae bacterium]|jgi:hypothetical protein|nr:hypothetical protein [Lentisphaerota bacterium]